MPPGSSRLHPLEAARATLKVDMIKPPPRAGAVAKRDSSAVEELPPMTEEEEAEFAELLATAEKGFSSALSAIKKIHDKKLFRCRCDTWAEFCETILKKSTRQIYDLLQAKQISDETVRHAAQNPKVRGLLKNASTRTLKEIGKIEPKEREAVIEKVAESNGKLTEKGVRQMRLPPPRPGFGGLKPAAEPVQRGKLAPVCEKMLAGLRDWWKEERANKASPPPAIPDVMVKEFERLIIRTLGTEALS